MLTGVACCEPCQVRKRGREGEGERERGREGEREREPSQKQTKSQDVVTTFL